MSVSLRIGSVGPEWVGKIPSDDPEDDRPFLLPGVRTRFAPIDRKAQRAAKDAARKALGIDENDYVGAGDALSEALIHRGLLEWEGVGDLEGNPIAVTPQSVDWFLSNLRRFEAIEEAYIQAWSRRDTEKNVSAGSPNGTSAGAMPALNTAKPAASPNLASGAVRTRKQVPKGVRTASTNRKPKKPKPSGK